MVENILFCVILVEGIILFSLRDKQKKKLYEIELWEQMELFPEAFQI